MCVRALAITFFFFSSREISFPLVTFWLRFEVLSRKERLIERLSSVIGLVRTANCLLVTNYNMPPF